MSNSGAASNKDENKIDEAVDGVNASVGANNFDVNGSIDMSEKNLSPKSGTRTVLLEHEQGTFSATAAVKVLGDERQSNNIEQMEDDEIKQDDV